MESECNCPGCGETFADPRVLPCKHVYCITCVEKMSKTPVDLSDPRKGTRSCCFLCDAAFTLAKGDPGSLPQSELHLDFVKTYKEATTFVSFKCEEHTEKEAVKRCLSGCGHVCQDCVSAHSTVRVLKGHQLVDVDTAKPVVFDTACPTHTQPFSKFCDKAADSPFLCEMCIGKHFEDYGFHQHENYEAGVKKLCSHLEENKKKIGTFIASIESSQKSVEDKRTEIEKYVGDLKESAKKEFEKARQTINDEEKRFLHKIDEYSKSVHKPYSAFGDYLKSLKMHMDYSSKLIEDSTRVFNEGKSPVKLPIAKDISEKLLQKNVPQIPVRYSLFTETIPKIVLFSKEEAKGMEVPKSSQDATPTKSAVQNQFPAISLALEPPASAKPAVAAQPPNPSPVVQKSPVEEITISIYEVIEQIGATANAINTKRTKECPEYATFGEQLKQLQMLLENLKTIGSEKGAAGSIFTKLFDVIKKEFYSFFRGGRFFFFFSFGPGGASFFLEFNSPSDLDRITHGDELAFQLIKIARELKQIAGI